MIKYKKKKSNELEKENFDLGKSKIDNSFTNHNREEVEVLVQTFSDFNEEMAALDKEERRLMRESFILWVKNKTFLLVFCSIFFVLLGFLYALNYLNFLYTISFIILTVIIFIFSEQFIKQKEEKINNLEHIKNLTMAVQSLEEKVVFYESKIINQEENLDKIKHEKDKKEHKN